MCLEMFLDVDRGFLLHRKPDGNVDVLGVKENSETRPLTREESITAQRLGLDIYGRFKTNE